MGSGVRGGGVGDRLQRERVEEEEEEGKRVVRRERDNQMPDEVMLRSVTAPFCSSSPGRFPLSTSRLYRAVATFCLLYTVREYLMSYIFIYKT